MVLDLLDLVDQQDQTDLQDLQVRQEQVLQWKAKLLIQVIYLLQVIQKVMLI